MIFKGEKISNPKKVFGIIFFIVCTILGIMVTFAIHYDILLTNSPGYPFDEFAIKFLWMDILVGIGVGFALFIVFGIAIDYYFDVKEKTSSN